MTAPNGTAGAGGSSLTADASAANAFVAATTTAGAAAVVAVDSLSPRPLNELGGDDEDWGPEGEEEFMSMLNLAMDEQVGRWDC